jgi:hypothetical protein
LQIFCVQYTQVRAIFFCFLNAVHP